MTGVYVVNVEMRRSSGYVTAPTGRRCAQPLGKTEPDRKRLTKTKLAKRLVHCCHPLWRLWAGRGPDEVGDVIIGEALKCDLRR